VWWGVQKNDLVFSAVLLVIFVLLPFLVKPLLIVMSWLRRQGLTHSDGALDTKLVKYVATPIIIFFQTLIIFVIIRRLSLPRSMRDQFEVATLFLVAFSAMWVVSRLIDAFTESLGPDTQNFFQFGGDLVSNQPDMIATLMGTVFKSFLFFTVFTMVLDYYGVPVFTMIATVSVVGVAIAFAVQSTLANVIAAIQIFSDRPYELGDFVEMPQLSLKGYVMSIGLRVCQFKQLDHTVFTVPNSVIVSGPILNYFRQGKSRLEFNFDAKVSAKMKAFLDELQKRLMLFPSMAEIKNPEEVAFITGTDGLHFNVRAVLTLEFGTLSPVLSVKKALEEYRSLVAMGLDAYAESVQKSKKESVNGATPSKSQPNMQLSHDQASFIEGTEMLPLTEKRAEEAPELILTDAMMSSRAKGSWDYWPVFVMARQEICLEINRLLVKHEMVAPGTVMTVTLNGQRI
jgi:MscS family membrane protein